MPNCQNMLAEIRRISTCHCYWYVGFDSQFLERFVDILDCLVSSPRALNDASVPLKTKMLSLSKTRMADSKMKRLPEDFQRSTLAWTFGGGFSAVSLISLSNAVPLQRLFTSLSEVCPKCKQPIEKNQGCSHMTCHKKAGGCGHESTVSSVIPAGKAINNVRFLSWGYSEFSWLLSRSTFSIHAYVMFHHVSCFSWLNLELKTSWAFLIVDLKECSLIKITSVCAKMPAGSLHSGFVLRNFTWAAFYPSYFDCSLRGAVRWHRTEVFKYGRETTRLRLFGSEQQMSV